MRTGRGKIRVRLVTAAAVVFEWDAGVERAGVGERDFISPGQAAMMPKSTSSLVERSA